MLDLSVVVPVYNGAALLERCINSIVNQTTRYSVEVCLVDDGSTDDTLSIYKTKYMTCEETSESEHLQFRFLQQENAGPAKARNNGMRMAEGRYIAFLDADDYWENGYVEQTVSFLDNNPECVAVSVVCRNLAVNGMSFTPSIYEEQKGNELVRKKRKSKKNISLHNKLPETPFIIDDFYSYWGELCHVGTCSTTMRRNSAVKVLMREDLRISEDYEFWLMLANHGRWGMIPYPLYVSDGASAIVSQCDWIARMQKRWNNAPTVAEWERRIVELKPELKLNESFQKAEGRVARNLIYCQLLSGRTELARLETLKYGKYFVADTIGRMMNICKYTSLTWKMLCTMLSYREYHRFE